jgi:hypothetical protein
LKSRQTGLAKSGPKLTEEEATSTLVARRLTGTTLEFAWVAEMTSAESRDVAKLAGLTIRAFALALTRRVLASGAGVAQRRADAALPVAKVAINAGRLPSDVDLLADLTRQAVLEAKV